MQFGRWVDFYLIHTWNVEAEMGLLALMTALWEVATLPEFAEAKDATECLLWTRCELHARETNLRISLDTLSKKPW